MKARRREENKITVKEIKKTIRTEQKLSENRKSKEDKERSLAGNFPRGSVTWSTCQRECGTAGLQQHRASHKQCFL